MYMQTKYINGTVIYKLDILQSKSRYKNELTF